MSVQVPLDKWTTKYVETEERPKCPRCGRAMFPQFHGAYLFHQVAWICIYCLHKIPLEKPVFRPPILE